MKDDQHNCQVPGCPAVIPRAQLMCRPHWRKVSPFKQSRVNATYRAYCTRAKDPSPGFAGSPERRAYYEARQQAIAEASGVA